MHALMPYAIHFTKHSFGVTLSGAHLCSYSIRRTNWTGRGVKCFDSIKCYADDCGIWYPITNENRDTIVGTINADLASLLIWGDDNMTTFEP